MGDLDATPCAIADPFAPTQFAATAPAAAAPTPIPALSQWALLLLSLLAFAMNMQAQPLSLSASQPAPDVVSFVSAQPLDRLFVSTVEPDLIIAATALHHGLTIVSRDVGGYAKTGVPLVNPWLRTG